VGSSLAPVDDKKNLLIEAAYGAEFCKSDPAYNYILLPKATYLPGAWTSLIGRFSTGYYHWMTDDLPRLALLGEFPPETKILVRGPLRSYQKESLRMLAILDRVRETSEKHLVVEDYYFSSPTSMTGCTNPYAIQWLRKQYLPLMAREETPKKFFIQRKGKTRGIINQKEVAHHYRSKGWAVVDLEELSLPEQIALFHNAEEIVGEHGAAFTNLIWCRPGCRVLELCAHNFLNGCYEGIAISLGLRHSFNIYEANEENRITVDMSGLLEAA
jgi:capsular polysaccharide biosynthesis protein